MTTAPASSIRVGDYLAHVSNLELVTTYTKGCPYVRARVSFLEGPDTGKSILTSWNDIFWDAMMHSANIKPHQRYDFEMLAGDWLVRVKTKFTHALRVSTAVELRIKE